MMADSNNFIVNGENTIPAGLASDLMRMSMENKSLLKTKGSIYVGTGRTNEDGVAITEALEPGERNTVLTVLDSEGTLGYSKVTPQMMEGSHIYDIVCTNIISINQQVSYAQNVEKVNYAIRPYAGYETYTGSIYSLYKRLDDRITTANNKVTAMINKWPNWPYTE